MEEAAKAEAAAAGGLEDDDVWGDVEDVSTIIQNKFLLLTK
jgi:hypothetical protein